MSNRRTVKDQVKKLTDDLIEECYSQLIEVPGKNEKEINKLIDETVTVRNEAIAKINLSGKQKKGKKTSFAELMSNIREHVAKSNTALDKLS